MSAPAGQTLPWSSGRRFRGLLALVAVCALAATAGALRSDWAMDAGIDIQSNRWVTEPGHLADLLTHEYLAGGGGASGFWRPVVLLGYWVLWRVGGGQPLAFMAANIALHLAISLGVVLLARRYGAAPLGAAAAGLLFAALPVHGDVVAMAVGLKDLLAAAGFLGGLLLLLEARRRGGTAAGWFTAAGALSHFAGLLGKESAIALLPTLIVLDLLLGTAQGRAPGPSRALVAWQYAALAAGVALKFGAQSALLGGAGAVRVHPVDNPLALLPPVVRQVHALGLIPFNLKLLLWPAHLSVDYSYNALPVRPGLLQPSILLGALLLAGFVLLVAWRRRSRPLLVAGLAIFGVGYLPASNLVFTIGSNAAERFLYLPSIGACLALGWLLSHPRLPARLAVGLVAVLALAAVVRSHVENGHRRSNLALWTEAIGTAPENLKARISLSTYLSRAGRGPEGLATIDAGFQQTDGSPVTRPLLDFYRPRLLAAKGAVLTELGRLDDALVLLQQSRDLAPEDAEIRMDLVHLLNRRGDFQGALAELSAVASLPATTWERRRADEERERARTGLGQADSSAAPAPQPPPPGGQSPSALQAPTEQLRRNIAASPKDPFLRFELSDLLFRSGDVPGAIDALKSGLQLQPENVQAQANLGILLSEAGRLGEAETVFRKLIQHEPEQPNHWYNLGLVLSRTGKPDEAQECWRRAARLLPPGAPLRQDLERRLGGPLPE